MIPSDFGYVYKTVNSANINKCAELGQTLYSTFNDLTFRQFSHNFKLISFELFFKNFFSGQDYFAVLTVKFFHFNAKGTAFVIAEIFNEVTFDHGSWDKSTCSNISY
ncbi:hypothetical protein D3C71_1242110 [compost metagenome]